MENITRKALDQFLASPTLAINTYRQYNDLEFKLVRLFAEHGTLDRTSAVKLISYIQPEIDGKLLSLFTSAKDAERNKRTVGKPAKLIRKLDPTISENLLEIFSVWFKDCTLANDGLILKTCTEAETFANVYKMDQANKSDPNLGHDRKSLAASCMRYDFSHLPHHPAYIYGTGDFTIAWIENSTGKLAARVVVCTRTNKDGQTCFVPAPIYTNSNVAADMLDAWIDQEKSKATDQEKRTWVNAKLLRIETDDGLLAPYFDRDSSVKDTGDFLVVSRHGDIELSSTHGTVSDYEYHCEECGCGLNEYDTHWACDAIYCENCFCDNFTHCDDCQEYHPNDDCNLVEDTQEHVCDHCLTFSDNYYRLDHGEVYSIDAIVFDVNSDAHLVEDEGKTWFTSDIDDEVYPIEDQAPLPLWFPDLWTYDQANESGLFTLTTRKEYVWIGPRTRNFAIPTGHGYHIEKTTAEYVLKHWLEWDGSEIVNNQLDLFEDVQNHQHNLPH